MNAITSLFLRAKHWQLFLLLICVPFFGQVACVTYLLLVAQRRPEYFVRAGGWLFGTVFALYIFCNLSWLWSLGSFLNSVAPRPLKPRLGFFRCAMIYPAVYSFAFIAVLQSHNLTAFALMMPFHLFAMFCMFYSLYFVSKNLVLAETSKSASISGYAGEFLAIWFLPLGIWIIQPRINKLFSRRWSVEQPPLTPASITPPAGAPPTGNP
jgi:hypothetical protein